MSDAWSRETDVSNIRSVSYGGECWYMHLMMNERMLDAIVLGYIKGSPQPIRLKSGARNKCSQCMVIKCYSAI